MSSGLCGLQRKWPHIWTLALKKRTAMQLLLLKR